MEVNLINIAMVAALCALTSLLAHLGVAVFNDGVRPIIPEFLEGRMKRPELALAVFGMSVGFIASVGIGNALAANLLNAWLLFLATDILGVVAPNKWVALGLGAVWGVLCLTGLYGVNAVLTALPIDLIGSLGQLGTYVVTAFAVFPILAIVMQFGFKRGVIAAIITMVFRILGPTWTFGPTKATISADSWSLFIGVILLLGFAIAADLKNKGENDDSLDGNVFSERISRIRKNAPLLMAAGALIAVVCNLGIFAGSDVSMFALSDAYYNASGAEVQALVTSAAVNEFFRGISFIPLIATTAITTGVYGVAGFTFVYVAGYLAPNPIIAAVLGAAIILIEVLLLGQIGNGLGKFPSIRDASDNIRSSISTCVEFAILFGSLNAVIMMGNQIGNPTLAFMIAAVVYLINEITGRKIMRMAIGPVFAVATGIILNLLWAVGLVAIVA